MKKDVKILPIAIPLEKRMEDFKQYLDSSSRIVFSAKFGDGKTYFLQKFKEKYFQKYYYITIHPVNYSVSPTDDIFEYIKRDILLRLDEDGKLENLDFGKICKSAFSWKAAYEMFACLLNFIPEGERLTKTMETFKTLKQEYEKRRCKTEKYFDSFLSMKGGIYEHDIYTKTIEEALLKIHEDDSKTVLIVEDLDRIDPKHLFRLLNVISVHLDETEEHTNKFGFDNIVLVMDYEVTGHIFHHFYGEEANYEGYMCKFLSCKPFRYSLHEVANSLLKCRLQKKIGLKNIFDKFINMKQQIDNLSLRDYVHIWSFDVKSRIKQPKFVAHDFIFSTDLPLFPLLVYMIELGLDKDKMIEDFSLKTDYDIKDMESYIQLLYPVFVACHSLIVGCRYMGHDFKINFVLDENKKITSMKSMKAMSDIGDGNLFELNDSNVKLALESVLIQMNNTINLSGWKK